MSGSTILIVDDDRNLRRTLAMVLEEEGYTVLTAPDGVAALALLTQTAVDLIFLDLKMPVMDGETLLGHLAENHSETPILILTAHATLDSAMQAVRLNVRDYFLKPLEPEKILERVAEIIVAPRSTGRQRAIIQQIRHLVGELDDLATIDPAPRFMAGGVHEVGALVLNGYTQQATLAGRLLELTPTSFSYLLTLARYAPNPVDGETLVRESQGELFQSEDVQSLVRWRIHELRKAVESDSRRPRHILTVRGYGYRLVV